MSVQQNKVVRTIFRTFVRLTNDMERVVSDTSRLQPEAVVLARYAKGHTQTFRTVGELRKHIRDSFRTTSPSNNLRDDIAKAIRGIQQLETILADLRQKSTVPTQPETTSYESQNRIDDSWAEKYIEQVSWLSHLDDEYSHGASIGDPRNAHERVELPLFPLTGPFFALNQPLELFTPYSYWEFPTPGAEIALKIFEPRYRELYSNLLQTPSNRRFVVPFAHPFQPATFAEYGLLYQITNWQEIADETNGVYQFACEHVVTYPVKLHRVLNPNDYHTQDTYLRVEGKIEMDEIELDVRARKEIEKALAEHCDSSLASKSRNALRTEGVWGFIRTWNTSLQQRLLQIELNVAGLVKMELQKKYGNNPPKDAVTEVIAQVQNKRRPELLALKLDLALSIPLVLQTQTERERLQVMLDLIASLRK